MPVPWRKLGLPEGRLFSPRCLLSWGRCLLYRFVNPQGLSYIGDNLVLPSAARAVRRWKAEPGKRDLERSGRVSRKANVNLGRQMVMLIRGQRALQASAKQLSTYVMSWALTLNVQITVSLVSKEWRWYSGVRGYFVPIGNRFSYLGFEQRKAEEEDKQTDSSIP